MEQKINVAELLKDCPSGMELDCTICDNLYFDEVTPYMIRCYIKNAAAYNSICFHHDGSYLTCDKAKCVIFPKGRTTWEGFQRPFKDGDVVATDSGNWIGITTGGKCHESIPTYCVIDIDIFRAYLGEKGKWHFSRLATEEEKQKLFKAIEDNGYRWNTETKTLEKLPKFKVGDEIVKRNSISNSWIVSSVNSEYYGLKLPNGIEAIGVLPVSEQDDWELVPDKFDITTLKPFDKVLVRTDVHTPNWTIDSYDGYNPNIGGPFTPFGVTGGKYFQQCIPYEGNEHLRGTTNACDDYYKNW